MSKIIELSLRDIGKINSERQKSERDVICFVTGNRGNGKCQKKGNKVLMSDGTWKNIEDVKIGDKVISPSLNGSTSIANVINISNHFEEEVFDIVRATKDHQLLYTCSGNHLLPFYHCFSPRDKNDYNKRNYSRILRLKTARWLFDRSDSVVDGTHCSTLTSNLIPLFEGNITPAIEPYTLGVWLGDGHFASKRKLLKSYKGKNRCKYNGMCLSRSLGITSDDFVIIEEVSKFYPLNNILKKSGTTAKTYSFSLNGELSHELSKLGLEGKGSGNKFIPKKCLFTSSEFRLKLLAGLIDTDGFVDKANSVTYCTKSKQLALDVKQLVFSLGGYASINNIIKKCNQFKGHYFNVTISFKNPKIIPLKIKRKFDRLKERVINPTHLSIKAIKAIPQQVYGIELDSSSKLYVTDNWMITHNSSLAFKTMVRNPRFKPWNHIVYSRTDLMSLMESKTYQPILDDEAIRTGFSRNFFDSDQKTLIQMFNMYRDNYNIYFGCIPTFLDLDTNLRGLATMWIHVPYRGIAVVNAPLNNPYLKDQWDTDNNRKKIMKYISENAKNPKFSIPWHRLSTFAGYLYFNDLTPIQSSLYKEIKRTKRKLMYDQEIKKDKPENNMYDNLLKLLDKKNLNVKQLQQISMVNGMKYSSVRAQLNKMILDRGDKETLKEKFDKIIKKPETQKKEAQKIDKVPEGMSKELYEKMLSKSGMN